MVYDETDKDNIGECWEKGGKSFCKGRLVWSLTSVEAVLQLSLKTVLPKSWPCLTLGNRCPSHMSTELSGSRSTSALCCQLLISYLALKFSEQSLKSALEADGDVSVLSRVSGAVHPPG